MTRFWITLDQAVRFVFASLEEMRGGEIFIPKLPSMKVTDLIRALAPNLQVTTTGIRPGEKLHEEMISAEESRRAVDRGDHYAILPDIAWQNQERLEGEALPEGFRYASDSNDEWFDAETLRRRLGD